MDFSQKHTIVCYIDKNKALFYQDVDGSMLKMDFPPDIISDQELTGREKLEHLIESFLETNKLEKGNIIFIYAPNVTIEKDFPDDTPGNKNEEIQKFINMIPFEEMLSKIYKLNKKTKVVAINQEIYESIKNIFAKKNFSVLGIIPSTVLAETVAELSMNIDLAFIANKIYSLKQYGMVNAGELSNQNTKEKSGLKKQNIRMYVLIIVFVILLFILIILVIIKPFPKNSSKNLPVINPPLSPTPSVPVVSQPATPVIQPSISSPSGSSI
ncbi:MAG: hypothetical protein A2860_02105 [Candidatus Levybacteria bacterium RIFCSPHIGHO2_01_FULL_37_33]|nr:MAG: hypothetical protein A2860_02105 [Candidatus Levybacteria bacterium RIFCSPHIGHO2_01_FULL_37_33]OGH29960.1 MAG: hypothetical protein A3F30_01500 [Candidatus Levybacteria bacterium RIFCSPHIGHO2_12_FULL_37_12]